jgi:oligoribonuclease NrnB/cAMP/cGMP phosphodiesterase (DHH superfamily)
MPKETKAKEKIEEEEDEIEEIIEEMEKEAVEEKKKEKKRKKEEKEEELKEEAKEKEATAIPSSVTGVSISRKEEREKKTPIIRDDLSEIENQIINVIRDEPRRPRAITRILKGKINQNEVVSLLKRLEEKNIVKREGTKSWKLA